MSEDQNMPKWALDPLLTESSPLQSGGIRVEGHGAVNGGGGGDLEADSEGDYDSEFSDEDLSRVRINTYSIFVCLWTGLSVFVEK